MAKTSSPNCGTGQLIIQIKIKMLLKKNIKVGKIRYSFVIFILFFFFFSELKSDVG